ncbi:phage tail domain-containing protein [Listeria innocua]|uniref:phage tail domain-containing protein n=1 Tax=Listeria innocua TaxID=1642 RepID=UPI001623AF48|nr:phage tail domain-containing protein [Listeria innocua]MBC2132069.1 phage tail family protein [Listeria innocua]
MTKQSKMFVLKQNSDDEIDVDELPCLTFLKAVRDAPQLSTMFYEFDGADGSVEGDSVFKSKIITCEFLIQTTGVNDYKLAEQLFYDFFYNRNSYYVRFSRMPGIRYKVLPSSTSVQLSENGKYAKITLELNNFTGYGESVHTSLKTQTVDNAYQFESGLLADDYKYIHHANRLSIFNPGSITIDPRRNFLVITVSGDTHGDLVIENQTTLERFECYRKLSVENKDVMTIERTTAQINGAAVGMYTNGALISLAPGKNNIVLNNITRACVTFDFHSLHV